MKIPSMRPPKPPEYPAPNGDTHFVCDMPGIGQVYVPKTLPKDRIDDLLSKLRDESGCFGLSRYGKHFHYQPTARRRDKESYETTDKDDRGHEGQVGSAD